ncbi:hypothetical protein [Polyangium spumosum]|uniref:Uncharacterized protein n=1 Tax=Polyangium spumosum TaxID=889282 RepID=A0A6N7PR32_9BACT|nr:hypothetical protein [Polyangium spumosum]MRG94642.1 hypothetical protein [Polyangium spumosum]
MEEALKRVVEWISRQDLEQGRVHEIGLPDSLVGLSHNGKIYAAHLPDGRRCLLLKKHVGWKGNFEGLFFCTRPLLREEFMSRDNGERPFICIQGYGLFEELYIRSSRDQSVFEVYFDLN